MIIQDSHSVSMTTTLQTVTPLDPIKSSTATTQVDPEVIVASGDTQYTRKQLRINNLHDIVYVSTASATITNNSSNWQPKGSTMTSTSLPSQSLARRVRESRPLSMPLPKAPEDARSYASFPLAFILTTWANSLLFSARKRDMAVWSLSLQALRDMQSDACGRSMKLNLSSLI